MGIRAVGPRAVIKPIDVPPPSGLVTLTDYDPPTVGRILSIGRQSCESCGEPTRPVFKEGDVVLVSPFTGQEITVDGETLWSVRLEHVLGYWQPEAQPA